MNQSDSDSFTAADELAGRQVTESLARLRNAFGPGDGNDRSLSAAHADPQEGLQPPITARLSAPSISPPRFTLEFNASTPREQRGTNDDDAAGTPAHWNPHSSPSPRMAEDVSPSAAAMVAVAEEAESGATGAHAYFQVAESASRVSLQQQQHEDKHPDTLLHGPLFSPASPTSADGDDAEREKETSTDAKESAHAHPLASQQQPLDSNDDDAHAVTVGDANQPHPPHRHSSSEDSSSDDLVPDRTGVHRLTAEEEQLARLRAYNAMADDIANSPSQSSRQPQQQQQQSSFISDTMNTILPSALTNWVSRSADVIAEQSTDAVPEGVRKAVETIGNGAQHIGDVIEHVPTMMVNAIPTAIMSDEVKQLLFTDFSNTFRSFFHTNILSMPFVMRQAGLVGGILLLSFVAITSEYATEAYFGAKNQMKGAHKVVLYGDVPRMVWGKWYPMINLFYGVTHLIGFIAFSSSNAVVLLSAMGMTGGGARALGLIVPSLIALPMVLMKGAHSQEPLAILSNLLVITAIIIMFIAFPYELSMPLKLWPTSSTEFFVALGVSVYAFTGIGSTIPVERVMAPKRYRKLLRVSVAVSYTLLLTFGLSGFLSYGTKTCSVMTVSLVAGPLRTAASALLFFASIMIIPQQTFPLCEMSDRRLLGLTRLTTYWDLKPNILRVMYLILSAFVAFIVPYYGLLLSISGALGCGIVGLVVPAALDYVRRERRGLRHGRRMHFWEYVLVFGLGFYGCVVVIIGVVSGSYQLWINIQTQSSSTC